VPLGGGHSVRRFGTPLPCGLRRCAWQQLGEDNVSRELRTLVAELRELADRMALTRLPTLLSYRDAARELGLKPTQFKSRYIATRRLAVYQEPGMQPRVPASEIRRIVTELAATAHLPSVSRPRRVPRAGNPGQVETELAKLKAIRSKRRKR
jgi:hypothetical protein